MKTKDRIALPIVLRNPPQYRGTNCSLFRINGADFGPRIIRAYPATRTFFSCTLQPRIIIDHIVYHLKGNSFHKIPAKEKKSKQQNKNILLLYATGKARGVLKCDRGTL